MYNEPTTKPKVQLHGLSHEFIVLCMLFSNSWNFRPDLQKVNGTM